MLTDLILDVVDKQRSDEELVLQSNEARVVELTFSHPSAPVDTRAFSKAQGNMGSLSS